MTTATPLYLANPLAWQGRTFGSLTRRKGYWIIDAERCPAVYEMAKRVFPGCTVHRDSGEIRFKATKRSVGDLVWLLLRWPLEVSEQDRTLLAADREMAIGHALRRERGSDLQQITPPATFTGELRPFQAEGVSFLTSYDRTLLADDMGLGKTVEALAAAATANRWPLLVICPANVQRQWRRMVENFLRLDRTDLLFASSDADDGVCHIIQGLRPYDLPARSIYIIHYGLLRGWGEELEELACPTVIFDEIQELRHLGTMKYIAADRASSAAERAWGLSGTPIYNYGDEIWAVLNVLEHHCLGDRDSFTREWCSGYGSAQVRKPEVLGAYLRQEGLMLRRRKQDVQSQLPPKRRAVVAVDKDADAYGRLIAEAVTLAKGYDRINDWSLRGQTGRRIEQISRMATGLAKAPAVAQFVRSLLAAGERVLLYAYHHDVHDLLADRLKEFGPVRITGRESDQQKQAAVGQFAAGRTPLVQLSLRSTAGLDGLQGTGTCVVFAELDWSPAVHSQCEDRLHRMGINESLESLLCYYLVTDSGMDDTMQEALGLKINQFVGIMGDHAESEQDRALSATAATDHLAQVIKRLKESA